MGVTRQQSAMIKDTTAALCNVVGIVAAACVLTSSSGNFTKGDIYIDPTHACTHYLSPGVFYLPAERHASRLLPVLDESSTHTREWTFKLIRLAFLIRLAMRALPNPLQSNGLPGEEGAARIQPKTRRMYWR
jgi:hypothetical protein